MPSRDQINGFTTGNRVVDLSPMDRNFLRGFDAQSHFVTTDLDHHDRDVVVDDNAFVFFSRENQHPTFLGGFGAHNASNSLKTP